MKHKLVTSLSGDESRNFIYKLGANFDASFYKRRTDRNIGWITPAEQEILRQSTVSVVGCGGMGGLLASILLRLGVGKLKIADPELFDESNINRQFGAGKFSINKSKAIITARLLRDISDDTEIVVYPMGINKEVVDDFVSGSDLICDEIEFWALGARVLLHQSSRANNVPILSANTVGHQINLFYFDTESMPIEDVLHLNLDEAYLLQKKIMSNNIDLKTTTEVIRSIVEALIPIPPNYGKVDNQNLLISDYAMNRLKQERRAPIIASNPSFASGFIANHVLFQLLKNSGAKRDIVYPPSFPGYLRIDSGEMSAIVQK